MIAVSASRLAGSRIQPGRPASANVASGGLARQGEGQGHQPAGGIQVPRTPPGLASIQERPLAWSNKDE
jgi:hypothetical protein